MSSQSIMTAPSPWSNLSSGLYPPAAPHHQLAAGPTIQPHSDVAGGICPFMASHMV